MYVKCNASDPYTLPSNAALPPPPMQVHVLAQAAQQVAASDGISCEVVDLCTLLPWDVGTVTASVAKTGRLLVSHEAPVTGGFGAELATEVTQRCFLHMEAPPARVRGGLPVVVAGHILLQ